MESSRHEYKIVDAKQNENRQWKTTKLRIKLAILGAGVIIISLLISTIVLSVKLKDKSEKPKQSKMTKATLTSESICNTRECVQAAAEILNAMNQSVNPCDNFYEFSCGNWPNNNPIPEGVSSWDQFQVLRLRLTHKIKKIVQMDIEKDEPNPVKHAKQFYKSCIGQNSTDQTELRSLIEDDLKIGDLNPNNIGQKLGEIRRRGGQTLFTLAVQIDAKNTSNYVISLDQPIIGLNRALFSNYILHIIDRIYYRNLIRRVWPLVYPGEIVDAVEIVSFETKIAQIGTPPKNKSQTDNYNLMTLTALKEHTASATMMNWDDYITEVFKDVVEKHNVNLGNLADLPVVVRDMKYFEEFGHVLKESLDADPQILINYLKWRTILIYGNTVSIQLADIFSEYNNKWTEKTAYPKPRSAMCLPLTNALFGMAISYKYVQDVFNEESIAQIKEMVGNIKESFYSTIDESEWINSYATREKIKEKAEQMKAFIGYPEWLVQNETALDSYYRGLTINVKESFFQNCLEVSSWHNMETLRNIKGSEDSNQWITLPTAVNAYYSTLFNSITFPVGNLQPPFYFAGNPIKALNYGAIGTLIGHEISHGFHDPSDWWDQRTTDKFIERAQCFANQYSSYGQVIPSSKETPEEDYEIHMLNGINTLGENIADHGGLQQSFKAYKSFIQRRGPEMKLPGMEYSPEQLFFVAFAQIFCGSYTSDGMELEILSGVHSPNIFRVLGALANSREFADTWRCPRPDPKKVCKIW